MANGKTGTKGKGRGRSAEQPTEVGNVRGVKFAVDAEGKRWPVLADLKRERVEMLRKRARKSPDKRRQFFMVTAGGWQPVTCIALDAIVGILDGILPPPEAEALRAAIEGAPVEPTQGPEAKAEEPPVVEETGRSTALEIVTFDGDPLECVTEDGEPYVSIPAVCRPFGKRADDEAGRLLAEGWARTRMLRVPDAKGVEQPTNCIHVDDVHALIFGFSRKGMDEAVVEKWIKYKKECAGALAAYFHRGVAVNPRADTDAVLAEIANLRGRLDLLDGDTVRKADLAALATKDDLGAMKIEIARIAISPASTNKIGPDRASAVYFRLHDLAHMWVQAHRKDAAGCFHTHASALGTIEQKVRRLVGHGGTGSAWENLPEAKEEKLFDLFDLLKGEAEAWAREIQAPTQSVMFDEHNRPVKARRQRKSRRGSSPSSSKHVPTPAPPPVEPSAAAGTVSRQAEASSQPVPPENVRTARQLGERVSQEMKYEVSYRETTKLIKLLKLRERPEVKEYPVKIAKGDHVNIVWTKHYPLSFVPEIVEHLRKNGPPGGPAPVGGTLPFVH